MKIRKTWVLAMVLAFAIAAIWSAGVARAAIDSFLDFTPSPAPAPPVKGEKRVIKSRPVSPPASTTTKGVVPAATTSSGGGGGHHR